MQHRLGEGGMAEFVELLLQIGKWVLLGTLGLIAFVALMYITHVPPETDESEKQGSGDECP